MGITRRHFLRNVAVGAIGVALPVTGYAQFVEPHHLTIGRIELPVDNLPEAFDGFRIAQISDLHYFPFTGRGVIESSVALANSLRPEVHVVTGDFITSNEKPNHLNATDPVYSHMAVCAQMMSRLQAPYGVFACAGNHDAAIGSAYVQSALADFGIPLLRNENRPIERDNQRIWIAGVEDAIYNTPDFEQTLRSVPDGEMVVLLAHEPDLADEAARYPIAVQLSGHSHGGQVRLPFITRFFLPRLAKKYPYAYYRVGNMHLYTNRGIGEIWLPYRLNAPPEVTLVTLRCAARMPKK